MLNRLQQLLLSRAALPAIVLLFLGAIALQWNGPQSIAVADEIGYVTSGVNLVATGQFTNPWGKPELWFPPVYPLLIGVFSLGGQLDPFVIARVISAVAAVASLLVLHQVVLQVPLGSRSRETSDAGTVPSKSDDFGYGQLPSRLIATLAVLLLAANPTFQSFAHRALAESVALCLSLISLRCWLAAGQTTRGAVMTGVLVGLATLTRPECILVAPLWYGIDWLRQRDRAAFKRGLVCGTVLVAMLLPYAAYLHEHTGQWSISNKGAVNLAAGRAAFHRTPREYIDEATLELGYYPVDTSLPTEVQRIAFNAGKLVGAFNEIYWRSLFAVGIAVLIGGGVVLLWRQKEQRLVLGLAAGLTYLGAVCLYDVAGPKNLHLALPAFSLLMAVTVARSLQVGQWKWLVPVCGLLAVVVAEGSTRYARWNRSIPLDGLASLREAGTQLRATTNRRGVMYEFGASTAYYSGQWRRYLTPNSLDTILSHIAAQERVDAPVYLTVSEATGSNLHPSTRALLDETDSRLERVLEIDAPSRVVIYRVKTADRS